VEASALGIEDVVWGESGCFSVRVSTEDDVDGECIEVFDGFGIVDECDGDVVIGCIGECLFGMEVSDF